MRILPGFGCPGKVLEVCSPMVRKGISEVGRGEVSRGVQQWRLLAPLLQALLLFALQVLDTLFRRRQVFGHGSTQAPDRLAHLSPYLEVCGVGLLFAAHLVAP